MNRDKEIFNKILFFVFIFALLFGAYIILGPKVTALISTDGSINEMNLSGTFRIYMFVQFISLVIAVTLLITQIVKYFTFRLGWKTRQNKNFFDYLGWFFSLFSVGGIIITVSWFFFFVSRSYQSIIQTLHEKKFSKEYFFKGLFGFPIILSDRYTQFFHKGKNYLFLKGMLSLLFWAILSFFLAVIIRFQAGTDGCEYSWRGDTQDKETIIREAKFFGAPVRRFVKIPQETDVDYLDYIRKRSENSGTLNSHKDAVVPFKPEYRDSKKCWRRYILAVLLFYAVFLRIVLAFFYFLIYKFTDRSIFSTNGLIRDHGDIKTQKKAGPKPFPEIKKRPDAISDSEPHLVLAFGFGNILPPGDWRSLFPDDLDDFMIFGDVIGKEKGTHEEFGSDESLFAEWLTENGSDVSDMIVLFDLSRTPIIDCLSFFSNEVLLKLPHLRNCRAVLSNGEKLRLMSSNTKSLEERVDDWNEKLSKLCHAICEQRDQYFTFETLDWYDTEFRTLTADLKLKNYLQKEFADRSEDKSVSASHHVYPSLFSTAVDIIRNSFDIYVTQRESLDINSGDWGDRFQKIYENHLGEGELRLASLYTTGTDQPTTNQFIENAAGLVGNVFDKGKDLLVHGIQIVGDVKETVRGNPLILRRVGAGLVKKFIPQENIDTSAQQTAMYNANREFVKILTEYALTLELQGRSLVRKAQFIERMMGKFSSASPFFERDDLNLLLTDIAEQIKGESF